MSSLVFSEKLGRYLRTGSAQAQTTPTYTLTSRAIAKNDFAEAIALVEYLYAEGAGLCFGFYTGFQNGIVEFLSEKGVGEEQISHLLHRICLLLDKPRCSDTEVYNRYRELERLQQKKAILIQTIGDDPKSAPALLAQWKEHWRIVHDNDVDLTYGLITEVKRLFGEAALEDMFRRVLQDRFDFRYAQFDVSKSDWSDSFDWLIYVSIESMRGHLAGPNRDGTMDLQEFADRVEITFSPCGTGGRALEGDRLAQTGPRYLAPYNFALLEEKHDFAWNTQGICGYCAHCAMLMEKLPIERFGYPVRVLDPPTAFDSHPVCKWTMYRNPRDVPASAYKRMGAVKPRPDEPLGSGGRKSRKNLRHACLSA